MSQVKVICQDEYVSIVVDVTYKLMTFRWLKVPTKERYKQHLLMVINCCSEYEVEQMLVNTKEFGLMTLADQSWLLDRIQEAKLKLKLKKVANIPSGDIFQQFVTEQFSHKMKSCFKSLKVAMFLTEGSALEWLLI